MNRIAARGEGDLEQGVLAQIALRGRSGTNAVRLISCTDVQRLSIGFTEDCHGRDPKLSTAAHDAQRDLSSVGDQDLAERGATVHLSPGAANVAEDTRPRQPAVPPSRWQQDSLWTEIAGRRMVRAMKSWTMTICFALAALLSATPAVAQEEDEQEKIPAHLRVEEAPPALRVEEPTRDPFHEQLALAANPRVPQAEAQQIFDELVSRGAIAVPTLARVFKDSRSGDQENWVAARALGRIGSEPARRALHTGLKSQRIITRLGAVSGLTLIASTDSVPDLERSLFDKAMTVRASSADALARIGNRKSSIALSKALNLPANFHRGKSHFVRLHIIEALGSIGSIGGIDALVGVLGEREENLQVAATVALETITGTSFKAIGSSEQTPPTGAEVAQWRTWWSQRSVGEIAE